MSQVSTVFQREDEAGLAKAMLHQQVGKLAVYLTCLWCRFFKLDVLLL